MDMGLPPNPQDSDPNLKPNAAKAAKAKKSFEEIKGDVATLADLVNSLKDDLSKAKPNELPPTLTEKVEQISKLAKRIEKADSNL